MIEISFVSADGETTSVTADNGFSLMEVAKRNGIAGIVAECGGSCACATCHVRIDPAWQEVTGEPGPGEAEMLDFARGRGPGSRLSCQIRITPVLDGLVVHVAQNQ